MGMQSLGEKSTYLVMMDFSNSAYAALKYVVSLAKLKPIHIQLYHVVNAVEVDEYQLNLNKLVIPRVEDSMKKMEAFVDIISTDGILVSYEVSYGNLLTELESRLNKKQPDVVVVPKRNFEEKVSKKLLKFFINKYTGPFLVVGKEIEFSRNTKIAVAISTNNYNRYELNSIVEIKRYAYNKLSLLHITKKELSNLDYLKDLWTSLINTETEIELTQVINKSVSNGIIGIVKDKKIELLAIGRGKSESSVFNLFYSKQNAMVTRVINKLDIPILIHGKQESVNI